MYASDTAGAVLAGPRTNSQTAVTNGLFSVSLDFGTGPFTGAGRWLEIGVRTNSAGTFSILAPRQQLTPTPYAVYAANVSANGLTGGSYSNALALENAANRFAGTFNGNGAGLSNLVPAAVVSPLSFGAAGDGVTVDDLAFSNAWFIAKTTGATFDFGSRGRTFVISNFVFEMKLGIALGGIGHNPSGHPVISGYGSAILHVGPDWLLRFTNSCPDLRGMQVHGNGAAPGGLLIAGPPSNGRMEDCIFFGYTNGIAVRTEGLTDWQIDNCYAYYSDIGFRFGPFCDAMRVKARADYCRIGFDFGPFPLTPSWTNILPLGGTFDLCANACGDGVVYAGRGALINFMAESCTNTFVSLGHQLERHGSNEGNLSFGHCTLWGVWGMGNAYYTNSPIEVYTVGRHLVADIELYGNHHTNAVVKSRSALADRTQFDVVGVSRAVQLPAMIELSTGERPAMPLSNYGVRHQYNRPLRVLQNDVSALTRSVIEAGTIDAFGAPNPLVAGFYADGSFSNLVKGITLSRYDGFVVTNANATVHGSAAVRDYLTVGYAVTTGTLTTTNNAYIAGTGVFGPGGGGPGTSGTHVFVTDTNRANISVKSASVELLYLANNLAGYAGTRSAQPFNLLVGNLPRWTIATNGDFYSATDNSYQLGDATHRVKAATIGTGGITNNGVVWHAGAGSPEGVLAAPAGSLYTRTDGGPGKTLYVKETASGNTGWVAK